MKKIFTGLILLTVILIGSVICAQAATYTISEDGTITNCNGLSGDVVVPNEVNGITVTAIGDNAMDYCDITSITLPDTVTSIGQKAFYYCESLESITIPDSVTSIGAYTFWNCYNLTEINMPKNLETIGANPLQDTAIFDDESNWTGDVFYLDNVLIYARETLSGDYSIKSGTTVMAGYAFQDCTELTSVTIPNSMKGISQGAFYDCAGITSIDIPASVKTIGIGAFVGTSLESVSIPGTVIDIGNGAFRSTPLTSVEMSDGTETIGSGAFYWCNDLESIELPETLTYIGEDAFYNTKLYNDDSNWTNNIFYLGDYLIVANKNVSNLSIKENTKFIAAMAFESCKISEIEIPDSVIDICDYAFSSCVNLTHIDIPDSITKINSGTFSKCTVLESVTIPSSVTSIDSSAFYWCFGLDSVCYGGSVQEWNNIDIETSGNNYLLNAVIYCNDNVIMPELSINGVTVKKSGEDGYTFEFYLSNSKYDGQIITSLYKNNMLTGIEVTDISSLLSASVSIPVAASEADKAIVFIWNSTKGMQPRFDYEEVYESEFITE